ncbi:DNA topoisomerase 2-binding protein 1 isoform X2 [Phymastichus coffea]|uniref:DNA topoisomerase 2-binding protein 1 isoform X2 n=1 Tax=Phymastichus coffea TaxID=108790 RepID=UPI00273AF637|nr:DNA topoisomerase 2-binding protein 1 isoform X2 [Phymastichus coffea]
MERDTNQTTFDVNVHFVVLDKYETEKNCNDDMWEAYNKCPDLDILPEWISEDHCLQMKPNRKDVFILEEFDGKAFDYLLGFHCMIIGPRCLLSCFLTGEPIPDGSSPVFNTAMRDVIVSASGFSGAKKNEIQKKVEYMGGQFTKQLRSSVTHLITDTVISAKYERAVELNIKIVTIDWIKSVWDTNLHEIIPATDSIFDKYRCPVFYNLVVTSTSLNKRQKEDVKRLITKHGGEFMGILDGTKVKIVITVETNSLSEKLKYAMQNDIPCLKLEWVHDSIATGYSLPFIKYVIKSTQACSTPEKCSDLEPFDLTSISVIPGEHKNAFVDETMASATTMSSTMMSSTLNVPVVTRTSYITVVERLNAAEAKKAGPFLDGCNIYLTGFSSNYRDKLNRILNVGSATRLDEISDALTHVIIGDPMKAEQDLRTIKSKGLYPFLLKVEWLEECIKIQAPATEENFIFDGIVSRQKSIPEPPSPLSKKNLQLLQRPKIPTVPLFDEPKPEKPVSDEHCKIVEQYLQKSTSKPDNTLREILKLPSTDNLKSTINASKEQTFAERWNESVRRQIENTSNMDRDDSAIPISQESFVSQKIFQGLTFVLSGFKGDEYTQVLTQIRGLGGKIVGDNYSGIPDYGVVPMFGAEFKHTVTEIVTDIFIEDCIDNEKVVRVAYYHRPIQIPNNTKPLENCVIGMSTYSGAERTYLSQLSEALGARYQDTFARKTNPQKKTYSSTHLICPKPQGDKYSAAVKWRLPAVNAEWLLRCASDMKLVDETPYLIGETMAPERSNTTTKGNETSTMKPPTDPTAKHPVFINAEEFGEGSSETPVINKRIKSLINGKVPKSPFHISTPDTPYGQVFKDNPSPATRKGWVKWIDHFPEIPVEEPPPKRRKSTPFSEVKKKAWDWVTGRSNEDQDEDNGRDETYDQDINSAGTEPVATHIMTNRRLSFSDDGSPKKPDPEINKKMAQLGELLQKASSTPEARQSLSAEHTNPYHLESNQPSGRCLIKDSQPDSVGWEDPVRRVPPPQRQSTITEEPEATDLTNDDDENESDVEEFKKPKFMFSGIKDKGIAEKFIKEHGGEVSTESSFDPTATHLLCLKPARNEKILSSIAAGKWVLHYHYIEACIEENKFINEEEYELGNPKSQGIIPDPSSENEKVIMAAAHRWRLKLLKDPGGAFQGMIALLITQKEKKEQFVRLINAGGGKTAVR